VERKNKTIVGAARAMLHDQGLPIHLWVGACNNVVYVKNSCPHRVLGMSTPEEAFTGNKLDVSHFKNFGSFDYVHVTKDARKKLGYLWGTQKHPIIIVCICRTIRGLLCDGI
jgi:hypothetical protein